MKNLLIILTMVFIVVLGCSKLSDDSASLSVRKCDACHLLLPEGKLHSAHNSRGVECDVCHSAALHGNSTIDVDISAEFDSLANSFYDNSTKTCNLVYCHGNFTTGTHSSVSVSETIQNRCEKCHDFSTLYATGHHDLLPESVFQRCGYCHPGYSLIDSATNDTLHINRKIDLDGCTRCHEKY